jgi:hypothetical protein
VVAGPSLASGGSSPAATRILRAGTESKESSIGAGLWNKIDGKILRKRRGTNLAFDASRTKSEEQGREKLDCGRIFARSDAGEKMDSRAADGGEGFPRRGRGRRGLCAADLKMLEE